MKLVLVDADALNPHAESAFVPYTVQLTLPLPHALVNVTDESVLLPPLVILAPVTLHELETQVTGKAFVVSPQ